MLLLAHPLAAQSKYNTWSDPDSSAKNNAGNNQVKQLVDKLNALIDEAEKARAADPVFLKDLRGLARAYENPWHHLVLADEFLDGNFTANPVWWVSAGQYWIDKGWGLRSAVDAAKADTGGSQSTSGGGKVSGRDAAIAILGALLKTPNNNDNQGSGGNAAPAPKALAAIHTKAAIANAFSLKLEFSSWEKQGGFDFGPYQGADLVTGYFLAYTPGGPLRLLRNNRHGSAVVEVTSGAISLEDRKIHTLAWTRDAAGLMKVSLDGKEVLRAVDRGIRDAFHGLALNNRGGDYIIKRIVVHDAG